MKKRFLLTIFGLASSLILTACLPNMGPNDTDGSSSQSSSSKQEELTVDQLFDKVKDANQELESLHFEMSVSSDSNDIPGTQEIEADIVYNRPDLEIERINILLEEMKSGTTTAYQHDILLGDSSGTIFSKKSETGDWTKLTGANNYNVQPDYFRLLDIIYSMEDDLELEENDDSYTLSLDNQSVDLVSKFSEELNMYVTGISHSEVDKEFEVTFDKESFYLTDFSVGLDYDGDKGSLSIDATGSYSDINEVDNSAFDAPE